MTRLLRIWLCGVVVLAAGPCAFAAAPTTAPVSGFKILNSVTLVDENDLPVSTMRTDVYCVGDTAIVPGERGIDAVIDLKNPAMTQPGKGRLTIKEMEQRAEQQRTEALKRMDAYRDPLLVERLKQTLNPNFTISEDEGDLTFSNALVDCTVTTEDVPEEYRARVYLIARMIAYQKSGPETPPFPNLAIGEELERRRTYLRQMKVEVRQGKTLERMVIFTKVAPLSDEEAKNVAALIAKVPR